MIRPAPRAVRAAALLWCLTPLAACSASSDNRTGLSAEEDRQFNEAAARLDAIGNTAPVTNESSAP